ncbi:MAG: hypothetical protein WCG92_22130, partial [Hyphomicrobiales bacterium]
RMTKTKSSLKPIVGTTRKSMAAMPYALIVKERLPRLRPPSPALRHVLGDRRLRDIEAYRFHGRMAF